MSTAGCMETLFIFSTFSSNELCFNLTVLKKTKKATEFNKELLREGDNRSPWLENKAAFGYLLSAFNISKSEKRYRFTEKLVVKQRFKEARKISQHRQVVFITHQGRLRGDISCL